MTSIYENSRIDNVNAASKGRLMIDESAANYKMRYKREKIPAMISMAGSVGF